MPVRSSLGAATREGWVRWLNTCEATVVFFLFLFPRVCIESGIRAGDDVCRGDGVTARGRAPQMMVRFHSARSQSGI